MHDSNCSHEATPRAGAVAGAVCGATLFVTCIANERDSIRRPVPPSPGDKSALGVNERPLKIGSNFVRSLIATGLSTLGQSVPAHEPDEGK